MNTKVVFSKYREASRRAAKRRLLWQLNGGARALGEFLLNLIRIAFILFVIVMVLAWAEELSAKEDHAYSQASKIQHLEAVLLSCLNGNGVYVNDEVHICSVANTRIERGNHI